jgi:hypothetical protein
MYMEVWMQPSPKAPATQKNLWHMRLDCDDCSLQMHGRGCPPLACDTDFILWEPADSKQRVIYFKILPAPAIESQNSASAPLPSGHSRLQGYVLSKKANSAVHATTSLEGAHQTSQFPDNTSSVGLHRQ